MNELEKVKAHCKSDIGPMTISEILTACTELDISMRTVLDQWLNEY